VFELKKLSLEAVDRSLEKAMRYRLLDEPEEAESICLDILAIAPDNQNAIVTLLLSLTDQFSHGATDSVRRAQELLQRFAGEYERAYYAGIIFERQANARLSGRTSGAEAVAFSLYRQAMEHYEKAEALSPQGNEDALLRWNTCARQIMRQKLTPSAEEVHEPLMLE